MAIFGNLMRKEQSTDPDPAVVHDAEKDLKTANIEDARASIGPGGAQHVVDPVLEKQLKRKMDWNLVPLVFVMYLLAFLDRSNIGNARIAGMSEDLGLAVNGRYQWLLTIFYISYILFQFQIMAWKVIPPHIWGAFMILGWGVVSACQAGVQSWGGEMALRFLLGVFEAGFGPGIPYLLSFFYLRHEVGLRMGIFLAAAPLATCFAGALAYGITSGHAAIANWKLLFLVEGLPTICMTPFVFFFLPDSPHKARFLNEEEKRIALARTVRQVGPSKTERIGSVSLKNVWQTFLDPKPWITALMYFSCNVSFASLPVFLPTILDEMGFTSVTAQGLTAPPYFLAFLVTIGSAYLADKTQQRGLTILILSCIGGIGYILLAATKSTGPRYAGTFLAASGVFPAIANILPWVANNQGNDDRRGVAFVMLNLIGQVGPILGTRLYPTNEGPYYVTGQAVCAAFMFFNACLALALRTLLVFENRKLDKKYGTVEAQRAQEAIVASTSDEYVDVDAGRENYGPKYRYVL